MVEARQNATYANEHHIKKSVVPSSDDIQVTDIKQRMTLALSIMQKLSWTFPVRSCTTSGESDAATEGFQALLTAVTHLTLHARRLQQLGAEQCSECATQDLVEAWPNVVQFLSGMCAERPLYTSKIRFVVLRLTELSPCFHIEADDASGKSLRLALRMDSPDEEHLPPALEDVEGCSSDDERLMGKEQSNSSDNASKGFNLFSKDRRKIGREDWVPDEHVTQCSGCQVKFGMSVWKHHCRACGFIFCASCTKHRAKYTPLARTQEDDYKEKSKRVCERCFTKINRVSEDSQVVLPYRVGED